MRILHIYDRINWATYQCKCNPVLIKGAGMDEWIHVSVFLIYSYLLCKLKAEGRFVRPVLEEMSTPFWGLIYRIFALYSQRLLL